MNFLSTRGRSRVLAAKLVLIYVFTFFVTGCASSVRENIIHPVIYTPEKIQNIYLVVSAPGYLMSESGYSESVMELRNAMDEKLRSTFPSVHLESVHVSPATGIKVNLVIEDLKYVSSAARFLTGIMPGKARLNVRVELLDLGTGQQLGESTFGTSSKTSEGIFGGTTSRQINAVADSIVKWLVGG